MSARWYKRCGADFIHGTMMLSLEEKGAYSLCLDLIYDRGGPIPDDARWLSGVCGVSIRKWNTIRERLLSLGKLSSAGGLISNARADFELVSAELSSRERAESGAKGGRKRAENAGQPIKTNNLAQAELKREEKIREDKKEQTDKPSAADGRATRLPDDWKPAKLSRDTVSGQIVENRGQEWARRALESFKNHWRSANGPNARKRDWQAAFANWVIEQDNRDGRSNGNRQQRVAGPGPSSTLAMLRAANGAIARDREDRGGDRPALPAPELSR